jgi:molybdate transport system substrate-binding protein
MCALVATSQKCRPVMKLFFWLPFALLPAVLMAHLAHSAELVVAVPAELSECAGALSSAFLAGERGARLRMVIDTSEHLYAKVSAGAPLDVYMTTHMGLQGQLLADGKMVYESWTMYAAGHIVLWALDPNLDIRKGIALLSSPAVKKVAIVDGGNAYVGPTFAAIHHAGLLDAITPRLLYSDGMLNAVKSVKAGKAQLAILSYETVLASSMRGLGRYYLIPENEYQGEVAGHAAVVTVHGQSNPLAYRFVRFLKSAKAQAILVPKGFMKPPPDMVEVR